MRETIKGYEARCTLLFVLAAMGAWPPGHLAILLGLNLLSTAVADVLNGKDKK